MDRLGGGRYARDRQFLTIVYFGFFFAVFGYQWVDGRWLYQVRPEFMSYNRDLSELGVILVGLPRWMIAHPWSFGLADAMLFLLPVGGLAAGRRPLLRRLLGVGFVLYLGLYLVLADIFWQIHHEPLILYLLLPLTLITTRAKRFYGLLEACRYYFLYIFVSAALWKIARGAVFNGQEMSRILIVHHDDLLAAGNGLASRVYTWLIGHPAMAQLLYLGGVALEACFAIGFFTRRYDRLLLGLALLFVVADQLVMRIPYWSLLLGGVTLWLDGRPRERTIVVYETTHHENLPALLDLCALRFTRVVVFLKEVSFANITGSGSPDSRWPNTEFVVQDADEPNRRLITRLFRFLRRERCSHLHLSTLDNNWLLFTLGLVFSPSLQVSLTVHEINDYFARRWRSLRDWTESLAKPLLHRRIKHYTFFLPAMAEYFQQQMPEATAVFLPSRFYAGPADPKGDATRFTVVLPGSIDQQRREYGSVVAVFRQWPADAPPVTLVLLGDSSGRDGQLLVLQLRSIRTATFRLKHYEGYIDQPEYERQIRAADVLWSPLRIHKTGSRETAEVYGQTTASGLTADLLLSNTPALAPAELELPEIFQPAHLPYRHAGEAATLLQRLAGDGMHRRELRTRIDMAFENFTPVNFIAAFEALMALSQESEEGRADAIEAVHQAI